MSAEEIEKGIFAIQAGDDVEIPDNPGVHYWTIMVIHGVAEERIKEAFETKGPLDIRGEEILSATPPGCWKCHQIYGHHSLVCPDTPMEPPQSIEDVLTEAFIK